MSIFLLGIEILIASFFSGNFIRATLGDFLVVILIYCIIKTITKLSDLKVALFTLIFAYTLEILQWLNIVKLLQLKRNLFTDLTLGSSFDWLDMLAYTLAMIITVLIEYFRKKNSNEKNLW